MNTASLSASPLQSSGRAGRWSETNIVLSVPDDDLSARSLADLLRLFEILCCFRAISPLGEPSDALYARFVQYLASDSVPIEYVLRLRGNAAKMFASHSAYSEAFDSWLLSLSDEKPILVIAGIERGSYEIVFHAVNLAAIFGIQEYGLIKDVVQWAAAAMKDLLPRTTEEPACATSGTVSRLELTPELLRALRVYDDVQLTETHTPTRSTLKITLCRRRRTGK